MLPKQKCNKSTKLKFIDALLVKFYPILLGHKIDQIWNGHTTFLAIGRPTQQSKLYI